MKDTARTGHTNSNAPSIGRLISTSYARALLRAVADHGHDAAAFVAEEGLDFDTLQSSHEMPADEFGRMYQRAMWLLKDESLGMVSGGKVASAPFG